MVRGLRCWCGLLRPEPRRWSTGRWSRARGADPGSSSARLGAARPRSPRGRPRAAPRAPRGPGTRAGACSGGCRGSAALGRAERVLRGRLLGAQHAGHEPRGGLDDAQGGELAAGQHEVADRQASPGRAPRRCARRSLRSGRRARARVPRARAPRRCSGRRAGRSGTGRTSGTGRGAARATRRIRRSARAEQHARTAAEGAVVDGPVPIPREVAEVDQPDLDRPLLLGDPQDALPNVGLEGLGEEGQDGKERQVPSSW